MVQTHELPSGWSTGVSGPSRGLVDPVESIGTPDDAAAGAISNTNTMFALAKGMLTALSVSAGSGIGVTQPQPPRINADLLHTLGEKNDAAATSAAGTPSAIALLKGICVLLRM